MRLTSNVQYRLYHIVRWFRTIPMLIGFKLRTNPIADEEILGLILARAIAPRISDMGAADGLQTGISMGNHRYYAFSDDRSEQKRSSESVSRISLPPFSLAMTVLYGLDILDILPSQHRAEVVRRAQKRQSKENASIALFRRFNELVHLSLVVRTSGSGRL
jgi:hypothetical protein